MLCVLYLDTNFAGKNRVVYGNTLRRLDLMYHDGNANPSQRTTLEILPNAPVR